MLEESWAEGLQFAQEVAAGAQAGAWTHPQLVTKDLLAECKGPDAEWLVQSGGAAQGIVADARALPALAEEADAAASTMDSSSGPRANEAAAASSSSLPEEVEERPCSGQSSLGEEEGVPSSMLASPLSSPEEPGLQELPAEYPQQQLLPRASGEPPADAGTNAFVTALHNPIFDEESRNGSTLEQGHLPLTPDGRGGGSAEPGVRITPGASEQQEKQQPDGQGGRPARSLSPARSLEAALLSVGPAPAEAAVLQQLEARVEVLEAEAVQLRDAKEAADLRAAALLDEVQLSFAALEVSQHARQEALLQHAQVSEALQCVLGEQAQLVHQLDAGWAELAEAQAYAQRLEYQIEVMQVERQEAGTAPHTTQTIGPDTPLDPLAGVGGGLVAEMAALRAELAEANRSKAVLASKLQACRADNAQLVGRLQASQARHAADLAAAAASTAAGVAEARCAAERLRAENQQLAAQVQLLQRQAICSSSAENDRSVALTGIVRQREEQLTQAHLEIGHLQARLREAAETEARCGALEGRVATLLRQHETLVDKLHAAQAEAGGWRGALGRLSEELSEAGAREAAAKSALRDTADRLLVQQQLCEAQAEELELLRGKVARLTAAAAAPQQQQAAAAEPQQPDQQQPVHAEQQQQQVLRRPSPQQQQQQQQQQWEQVGTGEASLAGNTPHGPRSVAASSEDDASPRSRKSGKLGGWFKSFKGGY